MEMELISSLVEVGKTNFYPMPSDTIRQMEQNLDGLTFSIVLGAEKVLFLIEMECWDILSTMVHL